MSKNQEEDSDFEVSSSDEESDAENDGLSESDDTSESEDEEEVMARLRERKRKAIAEKSRMESNEPDVILDTTVGENIINADSSATHSTLPSVDHIAESSVENIAEVDDDICDESINYNPVDDYVVNHDTEIHTPGEKYVEIKEEIDNVTATGSPEVQVEDHHIVVTDEIIDESNIEQETTNNDDVEIEDHTEKQSPSLNLSVVVDGKGPTLTDPDRNTPDIITRYVEGITQAAVVVATEGSPVNNNVDTTIFEEDPVGSDSALSKVDRVVENDSVTYGDPLEPVDVNVETTGLYPVRDDETMKMKNNLAELAAITSFDDQLEETNILRSAAPSRERGDSSVALNLGASLGTTGEENTNSLGVVVHGSNVDRKENTLAESETAVEITAAIREKQVIELLDGREQQQRSTGDLEHAILCNTNAESDNTYHQVKETRTSPPSSLQSDCVASLVIGEVTTPPSGDIIHSSNDEHKEKTFSKSETANAIEQKPDMELHDGRDVKDLEGESVQGNCVGSPVVVGADLSQHNIEDERKAQTLSESYTDVEITHEIEQNQDIELLDGQDQQQRGTSDFNNCQHKETRTPQSLGHLSSGQKDSMTSIGEETATTPLKVEAHNNEDEYKEPMFSEDLKHNSKSILGEYSIENVHGAQSNTNFPPKDYPVTSNGEYSSEIGKEDEQYCEDKSKEEALVLEVERQKDVTLTLVAEVERLRHNLTISESKNADYISKIVALEDKISHFNSKLSSNSDQFDVEIESVTSQHVEIVQALTSEHQLQVKEYMNKLQQLENNNLEAKQEISELCMKLSESDSCYMELDAHAQLEPERQREAVQLALSKAYSDQKEAKLQRPELGIQTDPDAVLVGAQKALYALTEERDSMQDDIDGLNYKVEELESEIASMKNDFDVAKAKYATVASTVVDHDDRANVLQFKLQAANEEVDRSNRNCYELQKQFDESQKELRKSNKILHDLQEGYEHSRSDLQDAKAHIQQLCTALNEKDVRAEEMTSQINDLNYELQLLRDEIDDSLNGEKEHYSLGKSDDTVSLPVVKVMRSTVAEEPDHAAEEFVPLPSPDSGKQFPGVVRKQSSISKNTTKKQQASVNFRKQQESASEPTLPKLVKSKDPPHKKKKGRKLKSKLPNQFDDYSDGGKSSKNNKMKKKKVTKCFECECRIKGEPKILPCELKTNLSQIDDNDDDDYSCDGNQSGRGSSSILDNQYMFRDKYGHRRGEEAVFCSWVCARAWNSKHTPLQHRRTTRQLINIADGFDKDS